MQILLWVLHHFILCFFNTEKKQKHQKILIYGDLNFYYTFIYQINDIFQVSYKNEVLYDKNLETLILKLNRKLDDRFGRNITFIKCYW